MKRVIFRKGKSEKNYTCLNGDVYDSTCEVYDELGNCIFRSDYANVDHTIGYKGGKVAPGIYYAVKGLREDKGYECMFLFNYIITPPFIFLASMLTEKMRELPSSVPNPNHDGQYIITQVLIHPGGRKWDYSHGCFTLLNYGGIYEFDRFINLFTLNEVVTVELV